MEILISKLKQIEKEMETFVSPKNENGFRKEFISGVYDTWSTKKAFDTEVVDVGYDCSFYPRPTNKLLSETCLTYKEFINANTGNRVCTYTSGNGMRCEWYSDKLLEGYADACADKLDELIKLHSLNVPEQLSTVFSDINELVFSGDVDCQQYPDLYEVCDNIVSRFGPCGYEIQPYQCDIGIVDGEDVYDHTEFSELTLADFKAMVEAG